MGRLRELDRSLERRWPWLGDWENITAAAHARFVMCVLVVGLVASFALYAVGNDDAAWGVAVVTGFSSVGPLLRLERRLAREHQRTTS